VTTLKVLRDAAAETFSAAGIAEPRLEARLLAAAVLGDWARLPGANERTLSAVEAAKLRRAIARRAQREPLARITGMREFWGLPFALSPETLEPRPDSETLVEAVLERLPAPDSPKRLLDLGTGSGCLLLALLRELPRAWGLGIDLSPAAARQAAANAAALGLTERAAFSAGDWTAAIQGRFDAIVSNPPYIAAEEMAALTPEVADFDPLLALEGGADGLEAYRCILPSLPALLAPGGLAALEIGHRQAAAVTAMARAAGLRELAVHRDLGGNDRVVTGLMPRS